MTQMALAAMRHAARGLLYLSERDSPFRVISLKVDEMPDTAPSATAFGLPAEAPVEEVSFGEFFANLTRIRKWHAGDEKALIRRYQDLQAVLHDNLTDLKVFRVGLGQVRIFIVGKARDGHWVGLETAALET